MTQPLALLLVEDDEVDRMAVLRALRRSELGATVESAPDGARAFAMLESGAFDAILLDYRLPDTDGLTFLRGLREQVDPPPAVIVLTGQGNEELALEMMEAGAHDYLVKDEVSSSVLQRSLRYALARRQFVQMEESARACQLRELSELSSKKDRFLSNVSHELRSPLSSISNFVEAILRDPSERLAAEHRQYLEIARSSVRRLRGMIEDLVETARVNSVGLSIEPRKMEVGAAMRRAVEALMPKAAAKGLRLEAAIPERPRPVLADPKRVVQMLINLIENAIKFTPEGGRIVVRARASPEPGTVQLEVADSGCGIVEADCARVFERLHRVKDGDSNGTPGLGIGLYLCRELAAGQGGKIWVESTPGEGSTFFFTLPAWSLAANIRDAIERAQRQPRGVPTLLSIVVRSSRSSLPEELLEAVGSRFELRSSDLLLPRSGTGPYEETFRALLWLANARAAEAVEKRLRGSLEELHGWDRSTMTLELSFEALADEHGDLGGVAPRLLRLLASSLGNRAEGVTEESVCHE